MEPDRGSGPSTVGDTADGNTFELYVCQALQHCFLSHLSFPRAHPTATLFVLEEDKSHLCDKTRLQVSQRLTGAAGSALLSTNTPGAALPAGAGSPTAGKGLHAKEALGECSVAMMRSWHTTTLLPGWPESKDIRPQQVC